MAVTGAAYNKTDTNSADGFSFANLAAGNYDLAVLGYMSRGQVFGGYTGAIGSTAVAAAAVPETETNTMLMLGLAGAGFAARHRNKV